ncbi:MAG: M15 family metallopeptidase [Vibrio sp.]
MNDLSQISVGLTQSHLASIELHGRETWVHQAMHPQLSALCDAAALAGFELAIASGFRDYHRQAAIFSAKFSGQRPILDSDSQPLDPSALTDEQKLHAILRWSALPGASRHHWGSELDVYAINCLPQDCRLQLEPWEYETGHQADFCRWLHQNMTQFGFFLPYAQDLGGVAVEPWHISFAPVAQDIQAQLTPELLAKTWRQHPFLGHEIALESVEELYQQYVINISQEGLGK